MTHRDCNADRSHREAGFVLIAVLAAVVVLSAVCVTISRTLATEARGRELDARRRLADGLLPSAERIIGDWLREDAARIVLPPTAREPAVEIFAGTWSVGGRPCRLRLVAWDQMGLAPGELVGASKGVATGLRAAVHEEGLGAARAAVLRRFLRAPAVSFEDPRWTDEQRGEPIDLNLSTAPAWLLRELYEACDRGGVEHVLTARGKGRPPGPTGMFHIPAMRRHVRPIIASSGWSVLIEAGVGNVSRRWWFTYVNVDGRWREAERFLLSDT
jgi:hypothetical protein